jgi:hypothetical protein
MLLFLNDDIITLQQYKQKQSLPTIYNLKVITLAKIGTEYTKKPF